MADSSAGGAGFPHWCRSARITEAASATSFWLLIAAGPSGTVVINVLGPCVTRRRAVSQGTSPAAPPASAAGAASLR